MKILVTGSAGFIGFNVALRLIQDGFEVYGIDNINNYYDVELKYARLFELGINREKIDCESFIKSVKYKNYLFGKLNIEDISALTELFKSNKFDIIIHLAAQAGVRNSINNPFAYLDSNIKGFLNILEMCRFNKIKHLVYASSSSVYGANNKIPFSEHDNTDLPISFYAVTKKTNELMANAYGHLFEIPITGLRFFTVYGPWGRPDMAYFKFTKAIMEGEFIEVYNNGTMMRDFTFIDDIVEGIVRIIHYPPNNKNKILTQSNRLIPNPTQNIFNIGNSKPIKLLDFIEELEAAIGKKANKKMVSSQFGDVNETWADVTELYRMISFKPATNIRVGIGKFIDWYVNYYKTKVN